MTANVGCIAAHAAFSQLPALRLGTDFGGLEVPALALRHLKVPFKHVFTSESCAVVQRLGATHSRAELVYKDARESLARDRPDVDVYIAGPPCQDFSVAGQRAGLSGARGKLFEVCLQFVRVRRPVLFIIENVKGLAMLNGGKVLAGIIRALECEGAYDVVCARLNTREHGVPQRRPRIYLIGRRRDRILGSFEIPGRLPPRGIGDVLVPFEASRDQPQLPPEPQMSSRMIVNWELERLRSMRVRPEDVDLVLDVDGSPGWASKAGPVAPCLLHGRRRGLWLLRRGRRLTLEETARLQGLEPGDIAWDAASGHCFAALGNSMSLNVVERLLVAVLPSVGLAAGLSDRWAAKAKSAAREEVRTSRVSAP